MQLWTAFLLGFVGSLHCAAMCGPLLLLTPHVGRSTAGFVGSRMLYHAGRLSMYGGVGAIMGAVGQTFAIAGLQRWVSFAAGLALLLGLFFAACKFKASAWRFVTWLKTAFAALLRRRTYTSIFCLGVVNGLLPCGLVYAAAAGAAATTTALGGFLFMITFGVATLPMLLGIGLAGRNLQLWLGPRAGKLIPASIVVVAALLILRSLALGIPYISPDLSAAYPTCH
jgi:uncharacterized protein